MPRVPTGGLVVETGLPDVVGEVSEVYWLVLPHQAATPRPRLRSRTRL